MRFHLLGLVCLLALPAAAATRPDLRVVTGTVLDDSGEPISGARVDVRQSHGTLEYNTVTDGAGAFSVSGLPPGAFTATAQGASNRAELVLRRGLSGAKVTFRLGNPRVTVRGMRPSEVARFLTESATEQSPAPPPTTTNPPATFTIGTTVAAPHPPRFGFNFAPGSYSANNIFTDGGGMDPYDARISFNATDPGTAKTFIDNDCADGSCEGTDFYQSIATGYFAGAKARVYRYDTIGNAWNLIDSGNVTKFTAVSSSLNTADHTITLDTNGTPTQSGDAIWLSLDAVPALPNFNYLDPRLQNLAGIYETVWTYETGPALDNMNGVGVSADDLNPYTYSTDAPPNDSFGAPGDAQPLSIKLSDSNAEFAGINQYFLGGGTGPGTNESLQPGHTYELSLWLKQSGIANGSVYFSIQNNKVSHTFTGVTGTWQQFTLRFPGFLIPTKNEVALSLHIDYQAPGTLWIDQVQISDVKQPAFTIDSRVLKAWREYKPQTLRMWTNFGNSGGFYSYWSLDSWLAGDSEDRVDPDIGNIYEIHDLHAHLPTSLSIAKSVGADPWLIVSMSLSEAEWGNLIDYLTAPAGTGYAAKRPASHPGPYTADFGTIYLEFGNEEWGTQETAVNGNYGQWVHYMLSQAVAGKSYFDPAKLKFIVNGFTLDPSVGSQAAAAAPEASVVDFFSYNGGNTKLKGDAYFQSDLFSLVRTDKDLSGSLKSLIDAQVAQQKMDAANGVKYELATYEGGPGNDVPSHLGDPSLAAGVGNLDVFLYCSLKGVKEQNFFLFNFGAGPYSSHTYLYDGFRPHPAWEALQMRNQYCAGDMVTVTANAVPSNPYPLISVYAFHEVNAGGHQADIVVISRDLNNTTPVTLQLPAAPKAGATIYTLTGDPRANNDKALTVPIGTTTVASVPQNYQFSMPPGSVYLLQVPLTSWPAK